MAVITKLIRKKDKRCVHTNFSDLESLFAVEKRNMIKCGGNGSILSIKKTVIPTHTYNRAIKTHNNSFNKNRRKNCNSYEKYCIIKICNNLRLCIRPTYLHCLQNRNNFS